MQGEAGPARVAGPQFAGAAVEHEQAVAGAELGAGEQVIGVVRPDDAAERVEPVGDADARVLGEQIERGFRPFVGASAREDEQRDRAAIRPHAPDRGPAGGMLDHGEALAGAVEIERVDEVEHGAVDGVVGGQQERVALSAGRGRPRQQRRRGDERDEARATPERRARADAGLRWHVIGAGRRRHSTDRAAAVRRRARGGLLVAC